MMRGPRKASFQIFKRISVGRFGKKVNFFASTCAASVELWGVIVGAAEAEAETVIDLLQWIYNMVVISV
jgi:hypothetical protein